MVCIALLWAFLLFPCVAPVACLPSTIEISPTAARVLLPWGLSSSASVGSSLALCPSLPATPAIGKPPLSPRPRPPLARLGALRPRTGKILARGVRSKRFVSCGIELSQILSLFCSCPALVYVFLGRNRSVMEDPSNSIWAATPSARDMEEPSNHHARWILSSKSASPQRSRESEERREYIYRAEELPDWRSTDLCANS
ncbi:uncharacterized protein [Triticum aestivum]|uniref:uncharacterized protein isoform X5 n=1 Tax=Triticum aestivum TaxID=4565 RepID=UPI001D00B975|nr:uncharacterized protein LOC123052830 isoform X5 [Triticum aestivum]